MEIKKAVYEECGECGTRELVSDAEYGCDKCRKPIPLYGSNPERHHQFLEVTVFHQDGRDADHLHFCCWDCALDFVENVQRTKYKSDDFITLPYLLMDESNRRINYRGFLSAVLGRSAKSGSAKPTANNRTTARKARPKPKKRAS